MIWVTKICKKIAENCQKIIIYYRYAQASEVKYLEIYPDRRLTWEIIELSVENKLSVYKGINILKHAWTMDTFVWYCLEFLHRNSLKISIKNIKNDRWSDMLRHQKKLSIVTYEYHTLKN